MIGWSNYVYDWSYIECRKGARTSGMRPSLVFNRSHDVMLWQIIQCLRSIMQLGCYTTHEV
jgi:hypothetical protein